MTNHLEHLTHNHQMAKDAANHVKKITDRWIDLDMKVKSAIKELEKLEQTPAIMHSINILKGLDPWSL